MPSFAPKKQKAKVPRTGPTRAIGKENAQRPGQLTARDGEAAASRLRRERARIERLPHGRWRKHRLQVVNHAPKLASAAEGPSAEAQAELERLLERLAV